jgi:hypothetical protein
LLEPDARKACQSGSEGGRAQQCARPTRQLESSFREIETYLRTGKGIRSKTPELVQQEIWGLFVTHYAIRAFMSEAADTVEMDPDRLSFTRTLHILRRRITDPAAFSPPERNTNYMSETSRKPSSG